MPVAAAITVCYIAPDLWLMLLFGLGTTPERDAYTRLGQA
ncbi:hypothetical protein TR2A62_3305 [Thalassobium sp. R2A62]|nr:hypothetical protein TR2A62_3305 [Thalassobium sp. R2A62]